MVSVLQSIDSGHEDLIHGAEIDYYGLNLATCSSDNCVKVILFCNFWQFDWKVIVYCRFSTLRTGDNAWKPTWRDMAALFGKLHGRILVLVTFSPAAATIEKSSFGRKQTANGTNGTSTATTTRRWIVSPLLRRITALFWLAEVPMGRFPFSLATPRPGHLNIRRFQMLIRSDATRWAGVHRPFQKQLSINVESKTRMDSRRMWSDSFPAAAITPLKSGKRKGIVGSKRIAWKFIPIGFAMLLGRQASACHHLASPAARRTDAS